MEWNGLADKDHGGGEEGPGTAVHQHGSIADLISTSCHADSRNTYLLVQQRGVIMA